MDLVEYGQYFNMLTPSTPTLDRANEREFFQERIVSEL